MSGVWVPVPDEPPFRCVLTGASAVSDGPFFKHDVQFRDFVEPDRPVTLFFSSLALRLMAESPGSPVEVVDAGWPREMRETVAGLRDEVGVLSDRVEDSGLAMVDVDALADRLVGVLSEQFARKAGRKPKADA